MESQQLNRAQRRAAKRGKLPMPERIVPLPRLMDEFTVFDAMQIIIDKISHGEIEFYKGIPVYIDNSARLCDVCYAIQSWVQVWQQINMELGSNINLDPLGKLHNKLQSDMPLFETDCAAAQATMMSMRLVFRASDRNRIASIAKSAQIKILLEEAI